MTTDEQWLVNAAAVQEKAFVTQQAKRRESLEGEIDGRSWNHEQW